MAQYEGITYSRQEAFDVERDLQCRLFDMAVGETPVKIAYHLCRDAALIGEFVISEAGRNEVIGEGQRIFERLCAGQKERLSLLDGQVLVLACVLLVRNIINASSEEKGAERDKIWQPVLDGLNFQQVAARTGCSEQTARKHLCDMLKNPYNVRFFADGGQQYYNTLRLHALAPEWSIKNLYNVLYAFYHKNLECSYEPGSSVAAMFVKGIRRRWENSSSAGTDKQELQSDQLSSSMRELFMLRPRYMAAVCDALLERIDGVAQGDLTKLCDRNRWDVLLREWYEEKTAYERNRMHSDRKQAVKRKVVDKKENIRAEYRYESGQIYLCVPGIRLPEIRQAPVLQLYQNGRLIQQQNMRIYGDDVLFSTHPHTISLNQVTALNWKQRFCFEIRILSGENEIYRSGSELFRDYLCFTPAGNETQLIRCDQMLRLIVRKAAKLVIEDLEENYTEEAGLHRSFGLWTESVSRVMLNGENILQEKSGPGTKRIWAYLTPEPDSAVTAKFGEETVAVYPAQPILHVVFQDQADAKNYQLTMNGSTTQLYQYPWVNGQFRIPLPPLMERHHHIQLKAFDSGEVVFQRSYTIVPGLTCTFDRPFYLDTEFSGRLFVKADRRRMTHHFQLHPGVDRVCWEMAGLTYEMPVPKVCAQINGRNAFALPKIVWHEELKDSFLTIRMPEGVTCAVVYGNKVLTPNSTGDYEIGAQISSGRNLSKRLLLGLLVSSERWKLQWKLTDICFQEFFEADPVVQVGREILWEPLEANFTGGSEAPVFRIDLENDMQNEPFTYTQTMKPDRIERYFPCRTGTYRYVVWLTNRRKMFTQLPDLQLLEGVIRVEDSPEERFRDRNIDLTHAYYNDPRTGADVSADMKQDAAMIREIQYEGQWEVDGEMRHEYSGILCFSTGNNWIPFSDRKSRLYEKINPVYFYVEDDDHVHVYLEDDATLMLNLKFKNGIQIFSRKDALNQEEQIRYLGFADKFRFKERGGEKER